MNESGLAVRKVIAREHAPLGDLLVVMDDFALPFGKLRFREGGGPGGHNGLRSIIEELGTEKFSRLRVGIGDPGAQAAQAMRNVKQLLEEAGSKLEHICKTTIYITDRAYREPVYREIGKALKGVHPCSTGLIVNGLAIPELLMEIDVEAVIPEGEG